jgi:serine/threonine protein phosphatase 1
MRFMVVGDIHGRVTALKQVLQRSGFDKENDMLIVLGDIVDGGYHTYEVVEELLTIKYIVYIIGNHDEWFMNHIKSGWAGEVWLSQGGKNTIKSYNKNGLSKKHVDFFNRGKYYYILNDMIFVHGGFNPAVHIDTNRPDILTWDRDLIETARYKNIYRNDRLPIDRETFWRKVFVGHTSTTMKPYNSLTPVKFNNLIMMDTGAGWEGKLTIMDAETEQYWQSDMQFPAIRE